MATRKIGPRPAAPAQGSTQDDPAGQVLRQFRQVFGAVRSHFAQVEKKVGLGGAQLWALNHVRDRPGIGVGDLARALDIHQSTASNLVKGLIERELIAANRGGSDRRAVQLELLPAGAKLLRKAPGPFSGVLPDALRRMDPASLRRLSKDLDRLLQELSTDDRSSRRPLSEL
ncbi:MarR family winged helix-turn-helix transcriptional regulator [Aquincola sp. J276]|uniref:MarR family winged helix-turn-helix transcriptional regulator n=1 Tax=Aquincola sp. J276 TaxID=2898432 RepID=UPI002150CA04|nr:MarR family winged helix-turn-helix transcriptional regulator [Aquincola sp. J276]MCR5863891.1 MarR family winged helix-turn-helix transcriptional regulator [Aquincola sp. J276]